MDKYGVNSSQANILNSLVYLISAGVSPFLGITVDKTGLNLMWCKWVWLMGFLTLALVVFCVGVINGGKTSSCMLTPSLDPFSTPPLATPTPPVNLGIILTLVAHAMLAFLGHSIFIPYLAMVIMGVAYSLLACALWPLVAFMVPEHQLGTAYGM